MIRRKALLVGCGAMSRTWLSALRDHHARRIELVGLIDLHPDAAKAQADAFGLGGAWTGSSLEEALIKTAPSVVFNCTIPEAHLPVCATALRAGCDVLVEKPLAPSVAEARTLLGIAAAAGKMLAVIQNRRYLPDAIAVKRKLASGIIGPVSALHADFFVGPHFGGFRETMKHPLLLDMAIHTFDQARFLSGLDAARVSCHTFNPPGSWFSHGASATAFFELHGGGHFSYRGSWCARGCPTAWAGTWRILGERGTLLWDGEEKIEVEHIGNAAWDGKAFIEPVTRETIPLPALDAGRLDHAGNIGEFLDSLDTGIPPQTSARDNIGSLAMVEAAIQSAEAGTPISLDDTFATS